MMLVPLPNGSTQTDSSQLQTVGTLLQCMPSPTAPSTGPSASVTFYATLPQPQVQYYATPYSNGASINNQIMVQIPYQYAQQQTQYAQQQTQYVQIPSSSSPTMQYAPPTVQYVDQYGQPFEFAFPGTVQVSATATTTIAPAPEPVSVPSFDEMYSSSYSQEKSCPLNQPTCQLPVSPVCKKRHARQRFAFTHELQYKGLYETGSGPFARIRVWVNERNLHYYDCECGKRKPVQDLYKIKQHALRHEVEHHLCDVCGKIFKHHLQMNAHMRIHKKDSSPPPPRFEDVVSKSESTTLGGKNGTEIQEE